MEKALLEIDTASALSILKLGINALKQNYVFQEFPGCLKGIEKIAQAIMAVSRLLQQSVIVSSQKRNQ